MTSTVHVAPGAADQARGRLVVSRKVVEKITRKAASEVAEAGGTSGGVLGLGSRSDLSALPKADVELSGRTASIDLDISVAYPTPIRQATDRVRQHVMDRVAQLTGLEVTRVDITVTGLHRTADRPQALR